MKIGFTPAQLADPHTAEAAKAVRTCVHCGICTATCPTYVLLGDERDGPRGRIVQMQNMLEQERITPETVRHVDRCLSCLNCQSSCPSSVDYRRLVDRARTYIETHYRRPLAERLLRRTIALVMTRPALVRLGLLLAPLGRWLPGRLGVMARLGMRARPGRAAPLPVVASPVKRIALMSGCVQAALAPGIDAAVARVLARRGIQLVPLEGAGCCGALPHHLGQDLRGWARRAIEAYEKGAYDGVLITATGCSAHLKDFAHQFLGDPLWEARARNFAQAARDFLELAAPRPGSGPAPSLCVAYHPACSLQNALKLGGRGEALLEAAGFTLVPFAESHLCCGSAGAYSLLQPELAGALKARKLAHLAQAAPDLVVSGNIGCLQHLAGSIPLMHIAELIDWAEGGSPRLELPLRPR